MRRRGEQGIVDQVFPVAGEFALGDHLGLECMRAPAVADDINRVAGIQFGGGAAFEQRRAQIAQWLDRKSVV